MSTAIEQFDSEIAALQAEIGSVERAPPTVAERHRRGGCRVTIEPKRSIGRAACGRRRRIPPRQEHLQRLRPSSASCMVVDADKLLKAERQRIAAEGEGMSAADKARRLDQLRGAILKAAARRELAVRQIEGDGEFLPRPVHPELAICQRRQVEQLAR